MEYLRQAGRAHCPVLSFHPSGPARILDFRIRHRIDSRRSRDRDHHDHPGLGVQPDALSSMQGTRVWHVGMVEHLGVAVPALRTLLIYLADNYRSKAAEPRDQVSNREHP